MSAPATPRCADPACAQHLAERLQQMDAYWKAKYDLLYGIWSDTERERQDLRVRLGMDASEWAPSASDRTFTRGT
jgi:conjugal transfer/entry exclusion protein